MDTNTHVLYIIYIIFYEYNLFTWSVLVKISSRFLSIMFECVSDSFLQLLLFFSSFCLNY